MQHLDYYLISTYYPNGEPLLVDYTKVFVYRRGDIVFEGSLEEYQSNFLPVWNSTLYAVVHDVMPDESAFNTNHEAYVEKITDLRAELIADLYETRGLVNLVNFTDCFILAEMLVQDIRQIELNFKRTERQYLELLISQLDRLIQLVHACMSELRPNAVVGNADDWLPPEPLTPPTPEEPVTVPEPVPEEPV